MANTEIKKVTINMFRGGTGDFFLLRFFEAGNLTPFFMMIDCGCIHGGKVDPFSGTVGELKKITKVIDLLVVTHEHADHINGFDKASDIFDEIAFKKVWFAWTEDDTDPLANEYRKKYSGMRIGLASASSRLNSLIKDKYYDNLYKDQFQGNLMLESQKYFIQSLSEISGLNEHLVPAANASKIPTMVDILKKDKVIKPSTEIEYLSPGDLKEKIKGLGGIRIFVLGPPKNLESLSLEGKKGESYDKREKPSSTDFAFVAALNEDTQNVKDLIPFAPKYELVDDTEPVKSLYDNTEWRKIDHDWLQSAGSLAMRFEKSINNTSLVLAIQFIDSEKVLLFPGDAEYGNWESWHDTTISWDIAKNDKTIKANAEYLLNNTIFYKVGHHLSQNGTDHKKGMDMMTSKEMAAMATLDFKKINTGWLNTMPNDILGAELIAKTKGKLFFSGDCAVILKNIKTSRVTIKKADEDSLIENNAKFNGQNNIAYEINV